MWAKKPYEMDPLFEWTLITKILFLAVTAVGCLGLLWVREWTELRGLKVTGMDAACILLLVQSVSIDAGKIIVPVSRGLPTFFIRIGMRSRLTCSIVNAERVRSFLGHISGCKKTIKIVKGLLHTMYDF